MASAATEREINKWRLWGVNKLLETNASLALVHEKTGRPPTLDLVKSIYCKDDEEAKELLEEARSSLRDMDMKWVILGACDFLNSCPLRTSKENGNVLLRRSDVFRTFGKTEIQGMKLYNEAAEAHSRFRKVRDLNNLSITHFTEEYLPTDLIEYQPSARNIESRTNVSPPMFKVDMTTSSDLFELDNEPSNETSSVPIIPQTLFELIKHTSYKDYKASRQGWDDEHKLEEMKDKDMRYLVVKLDNKHLPETKKQWTKDPELDLSIIGFLSFMITQEEEENVIYIYEIHISEHFRDCGLGQHLFKMVEHIGEATGMDKSMLTVFKRNTHARKWYTSRGYEEDEISPRPRKLRGGRSIEPDYEILSKRLQDPGYKKVKS
ncbi:hypothetical protein D6D01_08051 [Aureobasidium pullulans]|uniref:N-alpha-acetyltransferase 40 n=1 Tax=Aureobasidium pullulans TaxID=5580 RepID=A0A4S9KGI3_AURPU|nr:hypothetical protein D6D01_08051 [Aureobasidium pullulans]